MNATNKINSEDAKKLILAGNATITLESGNTGTHYTYKITRCKNDEQLYFVKSLRGKDNEVDYRYIGCYYADSGYFYPEKTYKDRDVITWPRSMQAIRYMFNRIDNLPDNLHIYHEGRCCRCGRKLTTPESIKKGIGPECERSR